MQKEINKLLKSVNAEKLKNNHKECIELYNIIAGLYSDIGSYDEAIHYHEKALETSKTLGDRLNTAICLRYIGEAKASLGQFYQAIDFIKKYLDLAQKVDNKVEIQRAWTTLGRVYLMQAQDMKDNSNVIDDRIKEVAREAEKRFQTALSLADSVRDEVGEKEFSQMKSALLVNLGLIKDICGHHKESVQNFHRAIEICKSSKLREDLFRCQVVLASIFRQNSNLKMATKISEDALVTAKKIGKKLLICDAFIERGLVKLCQRDFKEAKRSFAQAYLEKSPNEEDYIKAIRLTKLSHLISETYDKLSRDREATETRMRLCEKLGDLFVATNCYKLAIEFYKRAFTDARICSRPKSELAKMLFSVAETYADDGQFEHAKVCYEKELSYRNGNDSEQCQSLIKIAHMCEYINREPEEVCQAYEKALEKAGKDPKMMYNVLKDYVPYLQKKSHNLSRCNRLEKTLSDIKSNPDVMDEIEAEDVEEAGDDLEDEVANVEDVITDDEDNDEVLMVGRRRAKGSKKFKLNEVGETPLHEACIKGEQKRVESLLEQGHDVNPRDNAGWTPLHEACNHGHYRIAECLIEHGADVCNRGLKGMSPLHDSATNGHFDIMRLLIRNGANVIALTDAGETVLTCLRDFKKRNYSKMSNREMDDYKYMEIELLNLMDKCGFNLMDAQPQLQQSKPQPQTQAPLQVRPPPPPPRTSSNQSNPVKDYRAAIGSLKRKRPLEEPSDKEADDLPATYSKSAPAKGWLVGDDDFDDDDDDNDDDDTIEAHKAKTKKLLFDSGDELHNDDDTIEAHKTKTRTKTKEVLFDSGDELPIDIVDDDDDDDDVVVVYDADDDDENITARRLSPAIVSPSSTSASSTAIEPIEKVYRKACSKFGIEPYSFIISECKLIEYKSHLLDLSYTYWPRAHIKPAAEALAWRNFITVNLNGATSMIDTANDGKDLLESMATWKKVTTITMKSAGLARYHFDKICSIMRLPDLVSLDLSFNGIAFNDKDEFNKNIEQLVKACPKLERLDLRYNPLEFVKSPQPASQRLSLIW